MYRVELSFDTEKFAQETVEKMCARIDEIFESEELDCAERQLGKRIYLDRGRKQGYGKFWAAIFALKDSSWLSGHLKDCFWYNGNNKENLMTEFIRS